MSNANQIAPSPDGRWLAYLSYGVKVRSTDAAQSEVWNVSPVPARSRGPLVARRGRDLYLTGDSMFAARVEGGKSFRVVSSHALFAAREYGGSFDVMPNGDFAMIRPISAGSGTTELRMIEDLRAVVGR